MATSVKKEVVISAKDKATATLSLVSARFSKFSAQIQSVQRQARIIGKSIGKMAAVAGGVATAVGAGIKKISDYGDEMLTLAGIVDMPVESLQKLRYAAIQNDVSAEGFGKSLQMLSKSMGELNRGQGTLYNRLKNTNPALLKQLRAAKGNEEAFRIMMDAINKAGTAQQKAYLATSAFGKSGQELISLANIGSAEMAKWEQEAEKFGIISEQDATAMDAMNKSIDRVKFAGQGLFATIASKLVPAITPLIEQMANWIAENRELIASQIAQKVKDLVRVLSALGGVLKFIIKYSAEFSWLLTAIFYAKLGKIVLQLMTLGKTLFGLVPAFLSGAKAFGLFTRGISSMSRILVVVRGLLGKTMFNCIVKLASVIWTAVKAIWVFNAALWANPITWVVAGIIAAVAVIAGLAYVIYKYWEPISEFFSNLWDGIVDGITNACNWVVKKIQQLYEWYKGTWFGKAWTWVAKVTGISGANSGTPSTVQSAYDLNRSQMSLATMGGVHQSADINVRFDNLPAMTRIDTQTDNTNLDLEVYRGANGGSIQ